MSIYSAKSQEFRDIQVLADDLTRNIPQNTPANAIGFLFCDSQVDSDALLQQLQANRNLTIVGGTSFSYPLADSVNQISAELTVLVMEGLSYSVHVSDPLDESVYVDQVNKLYQACMDELDAPAKLIMPFIPLIPGLTHDLYISQLFSLAQHIPVFGGVTTDDLDITKAAVYAHGHSYSDRMVLIALGGAIRPVFAVGSQLTTLSDYGPTVTESAANIVHRVDDMTFCDYLNRIGIAPEQRVNGVDALVQYGPLPCRLRHKLQDDDGVPELRCISYTNVEEGSAAFSGSLPIGTKINMGTILKKDVAESTDKCLEDLTAKMKREEADGYQFSVLFSIPCVARYFALLGGENVEKAMITEKAPGHLAISTLYGFCEIGPTTGNNGALHNRSHNASIVMCAI